MKKLLFGIVSTILIYNGFALYYEGQQYTVPDSMYDIRIEKWTSSQAAAEYLTDNNIIPSAYYFLRYLKSEDLATKIKAGSYTLPDKVTFNSLALIITGVPNPENELQITFKEWQTIEQIIDQTQDIFPYLSEEKFKNCLIRCDFETLNTFLPERNDWRSMEGYLFPNTYRFKENSTEKEIISKMLRSFESNILALDPDLDSLSTLVNVASLIEKETRKHDEKAIVSGIIYKRQQEGIPLGIDATTRYQLDRWTAPLYTADFESDSPYNTRRNLGFPPTAISNFSTESFKAAMQPESSPYYYYLHSNSGQIYYGKDYNEHLWNIEQYLR